MFYTLKGISNYFQLCLENSHIYTYLFKRVLTLKNIIYLAGKVLLTL